MPDTNSRKNMLRDASADGAAAPARKKVRRKRKRRTRRTGSNGVSLVTEVRLAVLGRLVPHIAHELNQPTGIARMSAEASLSEVEDGDTDPAKLRRSLATICQQMERIADLATFISSLGRDDFGVDRVFDARGVIIVAADRLAPILRPLNMEIALSLPEEDVPLRGSPVLLQLATLTILLAAWDLLSSADAADHEAMPFDPILIHGELEDGRFELEVVCDTGRGSATTADGVSLANSRPMAAMRQIATEMGGKFRLKSNAGSLHVRLALPIADAAATARQPGVRQRSPVPKAAAAPSLKVLLVDDEPLALEGILAHLSRQGHAVTTAGNGKEALERFAGSRPDVVVTDLRMPVMSGNVLIRRLRAIDQDVPIIVMTGHAKAEDEEQAVADGASTVLHKPVRLRELSTIINAIRAGGV